MATSKRKRKYSQDFSGDSMTDQSFTQACDVNNIVRHYENTGIDPHADRLAQARYAEASILTFEDAMRHKAELDSFQAENPDFIEKSLEARKASEAPDEPQITPESSDSPPAEPAPQASTGASTE